MKSLLSIFAVVFFISFGAKADVQSQNGVPVGVWKSVLTLLYDDYQMTCDQKWAWHFPYYWNVSAKGVCSDAGGNSIFIKIKYNQYKAALRSFEFQRMTWNVADFDQKLEATTVSSLEKILELTCAGTVERERKIYVCTGSKESKNDVTISFEFRDNNSISKITFKKI